MKIGASLPPATASDRNSFPGVSFPVECSSCAPLDPAQPGVMPGTNSKDGQKIAGLPLVLGVAKAGLTAELVIGVGVVLLGGYGAWQTNQNPALIEQLATQVQEKFSTTAGFLKNLGIQLAVPSIDFIKRQIQTLFAGINSGKGRLQDMGETLVNALLNQTSAPPNLTSSPAVGAPGLQDRRMPVPAARNSQSPAVTPNVRNRQSPAVAVAVDAHSLPIVRLQIQLVTKGNLGVTQAQSQLGAAAEAIPKVNQALAGFYDNAADGKATLQERVKAVRRLRDFLNTKVLATNQPIWQLRRAATELREISVNPANQPYLAPNLAQITRDLKHRGDDLNQKRDRLKDQIAVLDKWLPAAERFAVDGSLPMPSLPTRIFAIGNDATKESQTLERAYGGALQSTSPKSLGYIDPATGQMLTRPAPGTLPVAAQWVRHLPKDASAKRFLLYLDRVTGKPLATDSVQDGSVKPPANSVPVEGSISLSQGSHGKPLMTISLQPPGEGGPPEKKPQGPNWQKRVLGILGTGVSLAFLASTVKSMHDSHEQGRTLQPDFGTANMNTTVLLKRLGPASTESDVRAAQKEIWAYYFDAANATLKKARWAPFFNFPKSDGSMFTNADMEKIRAAQQQFLSNLDNQPVPSRTGGDPGSQSFNNLPELDGDPLKVQHMNMVLQRSNEAALERLNQIQHRLSGPDPRITAFTPQSFDIDNYLRSNSAALQTEPGRKDAWRAVWKHHLDQVLPTLGTTRLSPQDRQAFLAAKATWLASDLEPSNLVLLPNNPDVQSLMLVITAAAKIDLEKLQNKLQKQFSGNSSFISELRAATQNQSLPPTVPAADSNKQPVGKPPVDPEHESPVTQRGEQPAAPVPVPSTGLDAVRSRLRALIADADLDGPPDVDDLSALRFTPDMFFEPEQTRGTEAIQRAIRKAEALFQGIRALGNEQTNDDQFRSQFVEILNHINTDIFPALAAMLPDKNTDS
jgi:hypothetical protein